MGGFFTRTLPFDRDAPRGASTEDEPDAVGRAARAYWAPVRTAGTTTAPSSVARKQRQTPSGLRPNLDAILGVIIAAAAVPQARFAARRGRTGTRRA